MRRLRNHKIYVILQEYLSIDKTKKGTIFLTSIALNVKENGNEVSINILNIGKFFETLLRHIVILFVVVVILPRIKYFKFWIFVR